MNSRGRSALARKATDLAHRATPSRVSGGTSRASNQISIIKFHARRSTMVTCSPCVAPSVSPLRGLESRADADRGLARVRAATTAIHMPPLTRQKPFAPPLLRLNQLERLDDGVDVFGVVLFKHVCTRRNS